MKRRSRLIRCMTVTLQIAALRFVAVHAAHAQTLDERIAAAPDATILLSFAARQGVCGYGRHIQFEGSRFGSARFDDSSQSGWQRHCKTGPVRVRLVTDNGRITNIQTLVAGAWDPDGLATNLGDVAAPEASRWLLDLAATAPASVAKDAIMPAVIAAAPDPWRELLALARNRDIADSVREEAVFWVGLSAAREATRGLADIVDATGENTALKKAAVFALSQRPEPDRSDHLLRIARTHANREVVASAFFWLAESPDERVLRLFEDVLQASSR